MKHEECDWAAKPAEVLDAIQGVQVTPAGSLSEGQEPLIYTGLTYSRLARPAEPSLEQDKLDLTDIIA